MAACALATLLVLAALLGPGSAAAHSTPPEGPGDARALAGDDECPAAAGGGGGGCALHALQVRAGKARQEEQLFLRYTKGSGSVSKSYSLDLYFAGPGGHKSGPHPLLMDTGSSWLNVGANFMPEGTYEVLNPQPNLSYPVYTSSGNTYKGQWVSATVTVAGANRASFTTQAPITVFRCTSNQHVAMLGVTTRMPDMDALNVFLHVPQIADGRFRPGYIVSREGVTFGYDKKTFDEFVHIPVGMTAAGQRMPTVAVSLTPARSAGLSPYNAKLPLLMDTGIDYTIIRPVAGGLATPQAKTWSQCTAGAKGSQCWLAHGVEVEVDLGEGPPKTTWAFNTNSCSANGGSDLIFAPRGARLVGAQAVGFLNTGRHLLASYEYLIELAAPLNATSGTMGFRRAPMRSEAASPGGAHFGRPERRGPRS